MRAKIIEQCKKLHKKQISWSEWELFIRTVEDKELLMECVKYVHSIIDRLKSAHNSFAYTTRIRKYCNYKSWTDVTPYEVVRVISPKLIEIRQMKAELKKAPEVLGIGGFAGVFDNSTQEWECFPDESMPIERVKLLKGGWGGGKYRMSDRPIYYYDYNF